MPDSWVRITCIYPSGWDRRKLLQDDSQTASSFDLVSSSLNDKSVSRWAERGCISCRAAPTNGKSILCQPCYDSAQRRGPVIIEVPEDHENHQSGAPMHASFVDTGTYRITVRLQFKQSWRHDTTCPQVRAVYKIVHSKTSLKKYERYLYDLFLVVSDPP